jgi:uncharacterized protein Usg
MIAGCPGRRRGAMLSPRGMKVAAVSASPDPTQYRLTTAEIVYRLPDQPEQLQTFIWQKFDLAPGFPELSKFLEFWRKNIEGELYSVRVGQGRAQPRRFPHIAPASGERH